MKTRAEKTMTEPSTGVRLRDRSDEESDEAVNSTSNARVHSPNSGGQEARRQPPYHPATSSLSVREMLRPRERCLRQAAG